MSELSFAVFRGFLDPRDTAKKENRYCVVLGMLADGQVLIAPATSYPARTGNVPHGSVLLTKKSDAYKGTGFTVDEIAISIRDAIKVSLDSTWCKGLDKVGTLRPARDKRFLQNFLGLVRIYADKETASA